MNSKLGRYLTKTDEFHSWRSKLTSGNSKSTKSLDSPCVAKLHLTFPPLSVLNGENREMEAYSCCSKDKCLLFFNADCIEFISGLFRCIRIFAIVNFRVFYGYIDYEAFYSVIFHFFSNTRTK